MVNTFTVSIGYGEHLFALFSCSFSLRRTLCLPVLFLLHKEMYYYSSLCPCRVAIKSNSVNNRAEKVQEGYKKTVKKKKSYKKSQNCFKFAVYKIWSLKCIF